MNILCVGGAGYIGGAITNLLSEVTVYDNLLFEESYRKPVKFVYGDIRDRELLKKQLDKADGVIWLAAIVGDGACAINPALSKKINQDSVKWLAENFDGRIVFPSTCSVYGAQDGILTEESPTNPLSVYAATKLAAEEYLGGKNAIILRLGTLFGLGDNYSRIRLDLVVNTMVARAVSDKKLSVFGGEQYRPLLHVKDVARFMLQQVRLGQRGVYNLHKENIKMIDLAEQVLEHIPAGVEVVETTFEDSRNYKVNSDKARDIGFSPLYSVSDGIKELKDLLTSNRVKDLNNPRYSNLGFLTENSYENL